MSLWLLITPWLHHYFMGFNMPCRTRHHRIQINNHQAPFPRGGDTNAIGREQCHNRGLSFVNKTDLSLAMLLLYQQHKINLSFGVFRTGCFALDTTALPGQRETCCKGWKQIVTASHTPRNTHLGPVYNSTPSNTAGQADSRP